MSAAPISPSEARAAFARLEAHSRLALAVSGGPDSLALLLLAADWRAERASRPELHVLSVDHGLRAESRHEAEMVGRIATSLGLPHAILTWEGSGEGRSALQARARVARYDLMGLMEGLVTPTFLQDHFQLNDFTPFHDEIRKVSGDFLVGKYVTTLPAPVPPISVCDLTHFTIAGCCHIVRAS